MGEDINKVMDTAASTDTQPVETVISALQALPFDNLIGIPLSACVQAQTQAANATLQFIRSVGFTETEGNEAPETVTVSFLFTQNGLARKITVPLLTLVPIPYMQIETVDLSFKADMTASSEGKLMAKYAGTVNAEAQHTSKYNVQNQMDIRIRAASSSMPAGLAKLLDVFGNSCIEVEDVVLSPDAEQEAEELVKKAEAEAERIKQEARQKFEENDSDLPQAKVDRYNLRLTQMPSKKNMANIIAAIRNNCSKPLTEKQLLEAINRSTDKMVATNCTQEEAERILSAVKKAGGKMERILIK